MRRISLREEEGSDGDRRSLGGTDHGRICGSVGWRRTRRLSASTCWYTSVRCRRRTSGLGVPRRPMRSDTGRLECGRRRRCKLRNDDSTGHGTTPPLTSAAASLSLSSTTAVHNSLQYINNMIRFIIIMIYNMI